MTTYTVYDFGSGAFEQGLSLEAAGRWLADYAESANFEVRDGWIAPGQTEVEGEGWYTLCDRGVGTVITEMAKSREEGERLCYERLALTPGRDETGGWRCLVGHVASDDDFNTWVEEAMADEDRAQIECYAAHPLAAAWLAAHEND